MEFTASRNMRKLFEVISVHHGLCFKFSERIEFLLLHCTGYDTSACGRGSFRHITGSQGTFSRGANSELSGKVRGASRDILARDVFPVGTETREEKSNHHFGLAEVGGPVFVALPLLALASNWIHLNNCYNTCSSVKSI
ncbi:hypothetical protein E2C01_043549 [Portunus trituberculatus]|uniref:Uncharacterized protein n=1 Tax=Portunus trituberculatus TaxID=210409 RepID=A0A5B7FWE6_PORTR|nr:hypothetical protein [Portunus trituberculatus]